MQLVPNAGLLPVPQPSTASHATATTHLLRQLRPQDTGLEHKENAGKCLPIRRRRAAPLGFGRAGRSIAWITAHSSSETSGFAIREAYHILSQFC
jgi:hypothetical protein